MEAGDIDPVFIRTSMMKAIASYLVAFLKREGMHPDQAIRLLGISKRQLQELTRADVSSFELERMVDVLASVSQYISGHKIPIPTTLRIK